MSVSKVICFCATIRVRLTQRSLWCDALLVLAIREIIADRMVLYGPGNLGRGGDRDNVYTKGYIPPMYTQT